VLPKRGEGLLLENRIFLLVGSDRRFEAQWAGTGLVNFFTGK